jgi:hypothetical protein
MSAPWIAAGVVATYLVATFGVFRALNAGVPLWLEGWLSAFAAPGALAFLAWGPTLKRLGLSRGEMVLVPHPVAFVLLTLLYAALAFVIVALVMRLMSR